MWWRNYSYTLSEKQNWVYLWINILKFYTVCFLLYANLRTIEDNDTKLQTVTLNSYKAFLKNKKRSSKSLCLIFYKFFEKKNLLYSITWPLNSNFHHPVKKVLLLLPTKTQFNPHWGNFYNMLFFSFQKGLNGQNHSSSDSHHHIKIPLPAKFPISPTGTYPRVSHRCWEHGGGGRLGGGGNRILSKNIYEGVHMLVKVPAISLQAWKFTKNELLHKYFSRILARF